MVLRELDLGIIPALLTPIIQVIMVYHLVLVVITEVYIGLSPANFLCKTMLD